ncbi:MAG: heme exporter protein CcmB [Candidatus Acidiferrales bacterium]
MRGLRAAFTLFAKECRLEFRTRELLTATVVFSLIIIVFFNFAFDPTPVEARRFGPGLLWIAFFFAGSLMVNPSFAREQTNDTLDALRMAPIPSFAVLSAKILANLVFLSIAEAILVPVFSLFYNVSLVGILGRLVLVLFLGTVGLVTTGTVFSAISAHARMRELLLPVLLLPFLTPLLIAAVSTTIALFGEARELDRTWMIFLIGFDVIFLTTSWLLSDFLAEG